MGTHVSVFVVKKVNLEKALKEIDGTQVKPDHYFYFSDNNAFCCWFDKHVAKLDLAKGNCIVFAKHQQLKLLSALNKIDATNCHLLYPTSNNEQLGDDSYSDNYWRDVNIIRGMLLFLLSGVGDDPNVVLFQAILNPYSKK